MDDHPGAGGGIAVTGFQETTDRYEQWLATKLTIVTADLDKKHAAMKAGIFPFLRATFYRWAELWGEVCPELAGAPELLAVGDLHVENFGTWRDAEGRLVWGINDFDETCRMPFAVDLVRLASSAHLAIDIDRLKLDHADACRFLLKGYQDGLEEGGRPWVLGSGHPWLLTMVGPGLKDPAVFWAKLNGLESYRGKVPKQVRRVLQTTLPGGPRKFQIAHRIAGLGSLGRQRFVALSDYKGDYVCREAKALAPSAWNWAVGRAEGGIRYQKALDLAVRDPDPCVSQQKAGFCGGLRRTVPVWTWRFSRACAMRSGCCRQWAGRLQICTWVLVARGRFSPISSIGQPHGCTMRRPP
jgi:hypothetical protein